MVSFAVLLLVVATGLHLYFAMRLSVLNSGHRIPVVVGRYHVRPPLRIVACQAVGIACSVVAAVIVNARVWDSGPVAAAVAAGLMTGVPILVPSSVVLPMHNMGIARSSTKSA